MTQRVRAAMALGLSGALAGSVLLAGCGNATVKSENNPTTGSSAGGTKNMLVAMDNGSPTFDKNFNPFSGGKRTTSNIIYEPLFVMNQMDGKLVPFLGSEYSQPDAKTIQVTLRDGVKWTDGKDFTADDVTFTYDLVKKFPALDTLGVWQQLAGVKADGNKLTFTLKEANVPAAGIVLQQTIVPKHLWESQADPVTWKNDSPVGTGPYKLGTFGPNQYTLTKNIDYWNKDKVAADTLTLPASNTQLDLVNKGYDWAYAYISDVDNTWGKAAEGNSYWFPPGGTISIYPNLTKKPFSDANFRKGISLALDRKKIADVAEEGYVEPAGLTGLLLPNQQSWLDSSIPNGGAETPNTEEALKLLQQAGYTKSGDKLVDSSGKQLAVSLQTPNGWTDWLRGAQEVQKELSALGIAVTLQQPQPAAAQQNVQNGNFELALQSFGGTGVVYNDYNALLNSQFATPVGTTTSSNFQRYKNPEADKQLTVLKTSTDEAAQQQAAHALQKIMVDDRPVVPLFYGGLWGLFSEKNFTGWPSKDNPYASPATWGNNPLLIVTTITAK